MRRSLVGMILLLFFCAAPPSHAAPSQQRIDSQVDAYLRPYIDLDLFQGSILIAKGDTVLLTKSYGIANGELAVPNRPTQVFRIASLTKPFTEVALGRLVEQSRIQLSDPLSKYIPDFPKGDSITLEMLRTHRAGIPNQNSIPFDEAASGPNTLD